MVACQIFVLVTLLCVCHRVRSGRRNSVVVGGLVDVVARVSGAAGAEAHRG